MHLVVGQSGSISWMPTDDSGSFIRLAVGRVGRPVGVKGDLYVTSLTDEPELRFEPGQVVLADGATALTVTALRTQSGRLVVHFAEVDDRDQASELTGKLLEVDVDPHQLPNSSDEFYDHQLIGLSVVDSANEPLGAVRSVDHLPAHDYLVVARTSGPDVLLPFIPEMVTAVDLDKGVVTARPPQGLFEEVPDED